MCVIFSILCGHSQNKDVWTSLYPVVITFLCYSKTTILRTWHISRPYIMFVYKYFWKMSRWILVFIYKTWHWKYFLTYNKRIIQHPMIDYLTRHKKYYACIFIVFLMVANVHFLRWCKRANLNAFFSIFISSLWHLIYDVRCDWITYCYSLSQILLPSKIYSLNFWNKIHVFYHRITWLTIFGNSKRFRNHFDTVQLKTNYVTCNDKDILFRP